MTTTTTHPSLDDTARRAHTGELDFPEVVARLIAVGVESYTVDYRRGDATYYLAAGTPHTVPLHLPQAAIADAFATNAVRDAVRGAQRGELRYPEFTRRICTAGCVGYHAWLAGRHVTYLGRRGETHIERFPDPTAPAPRPNVALVQHIYAAFARRDLAAAFASFAPDIVLDQSRELPWGDHYTGHDGARAFFTRLASRVDSTLDLDHFIDAGDHVVAVGRTRGTLRDSDRRYDVPIAHAWHIRDGQVVRVHFMIDNPTMLAALA